MVNNWINIIQDYLIPPSCILCGYPGKNSMDICNICLDLLERNNHCCYRCGINYQHKNQTKTLCGECISNERGFDVTYAPFQYRGAIRYLISGLKFNAQLKNARLLGMLLSQQLKLRTELPECIIPMPLHPDRYNERGFNQAEEIAKTISNILALPINYNSCLRNRNTPHQINLSADQRRKNLKNAFDVQNLPAQHVAIIDDVMTTGTTASELAKTLKKAGAERVEIWVCARA